MPNKFTIFDLLIFLLILGMFFRVYQPITRLNYGHDADLASWVVKDIIFDGHPRLIGQLTTAPGIFIGSLTYYSQIPAYWLTHWDPVGSLAWNWILSLASLFSIFWVMVKLYGKKAAIITTLMFAASFDIASTERVAVPTALVFIWMVWFYYFLHRLFAGDSKSLFGLAVLFALVWHIHLALGLLFPLVVFGIILNAKNLKLKQLVLSILLGLVLVSPLALFEIKHNFQQTRALMSGQHANASVAKLHHVMDYVARNINETYWPRPNNGLEWLMPLILIASVVYLVKAGVYSKTWFVVLLSWYVITIGFFLFNSINLSEYYLHSLNIVWIITFGLVVSRLDRRLAVGVLAFVVGFNLYRLLSMAPSHNGYLERKQITEFIARDAAAHGYDCVSVSYFTDPGYNLGYRYLFFRLGLHVNLPASGSPVYTIVFPHKLADHIDFAFGSLGLEVPDYSRYTAAQVKASCAGPNENVTGSMFGFTK